MTSPAFSVVIPTRQRHETLAWSLQTCLNQDFDDFEVVVCDNFSTPETAEVVQAAGSSRIKYVRASEPLAMAENWNLAVSNADGDYVIVIGDDDGLLPNTLRDLATIVDRTQATAIRWPVADYAWPGMPAEVEHIISLPLGTRPERIVGREIVRSVVSRQADRNMLPMLYNAAIHKSLIAELVARTGTVFAACNPDVYSGLAFAILSGEYVSTQRIMAINATSPKSNGYAHFYGDKKSEIAAEFESLNRKLPFSWPESIPYVGVEAACIFEAYTRICENLFPDGGAPKTFSQREVIQAILKDYSETRALPFSSVKQEVCRTLNDEGMREWFDRQSSRFSDDGESSDADSEPRSILGCRSSRLRVDASRFGVANIVDACRFCHDLLSYDQPLEETYLQDTPGKKLIQRSRRLVRQILARD